MQKHIIEYEQVKEAQQKEEEESVPVVKEILEETKEIGRASCRERV